MESNNLENMKVGIKDKLTCFICGAKVKDPMMCLKCKNLGCSQCIKKWFESGNNTCPSCKSETNINSMIALPFVNYLSDYFVKNIENEEKIQNNINYNNNAYNNIINDDNNYLSKTQIMNNKFQIDEDEVRKKEWNEIKIKGEKCERHPDEIVEYYCLNCNSKYCSKCLMINNEESKIHYKHKIISIEQKNKFKIEEIKNEINNLSSVTNEIKVYKNNVELENKLIGIKEEFIYKVIIDFKNLISGKYERKKAALDEKNRLIKNQIDNISNVKNTYIEAINNFIEREDINGFKEYYNKLKKFKDINRYKHKSTFNIYLKPSLKFYETDFIQMDINEYNETIGEIYFNVEEFNNQLLLKLSGEAINEVLINLLIHLENPGEKRQEYYGCLLIKNKDNIFSISLDEKMVHNETLILGKTIIKSCLNSLVDQHNKCHAKVILGYISF
jgi:hypothetical protein